MTATRTEHQIVISFISLTDKGHASFDEIAMTCTPELPRQVLTNFLKYMSYEMLDPSISPATSAN